MPEKQIKTENKDPLEITDTAREMCFRSSINDEPWK